MSAKQGNGSQITLLERVGLFLGGGTLFAMASAEIAFMGWLFLRVG
jgi:hypothetical protein